MQRLSRFSFSFFTMSFLIACFFTMAYQSLQVPPPAYAESVANSATNPADSERPTKPTDLQVANLQTTSLTLSWNTSVDNIAVVQYDIYANNVFFATVKTTDGNPPATSVEMTGLTPAHTYRFAVVAVDAAGNFSDTDPLEITMKPPIDEQKPKQPAELSFISVKSNAFIVTWPAVKDNIGVAIYTVCWRQMSATQGTCDTMDVAGKEQLVYSYQVSGLTTYEEYVVRIQAIDAAGNRSEWSDAFKIRTTDVLNPKPPLGLQVTEKTPTGFSFRWSPSTDNAGVKGYEIYLNNKILETIQASAKPAYSIKKLQPSTVYSVKLRAFDAAGNNSEFSNTLSVTTDKKQTLAFTSGLTESVASYNSFTVSWTCIRNNPNVSGYNVYRDAVLVEKNGPQTCSSELSDAISGKQYALKVFAFDKSGATVALTDKYTFNPTLNWNGSTLTFSGRTINTGGSRNLGGEIAFPHQPVFRALGLNANFNKVSNTITATKAGGATIRITTGSNKATVNGRAVTMKRSAEIFDGVPYVPLSFFKQALGVTVKQ